MKHYSKNVGKSETRLEHNAVIAELRHKIGVRVLWLAPLEIFLYYCMCGDQSRLLRFRFITCSDQDETYRLKQYDNHVFYPRRSSFFGSDLGSRESLHTNCLTLKYTTAHQLIDNIDIVCVISAEVSIV